MNAIAPAHPEAVFTRRGLRSALGICFLAMTLVASTAYFDTPSLPSNGFRTLIVLGCAWMTVRSALCATILVRSDQVVFRTFLRTYRMTRSEVADFALFDTPSGYGGVGVSVSARMVHGKVIKAGEFWSSVKPGTNPMDTTCGRIVNDLNSWLNLRSGTD